MLYSKSTYKKQDEKCRNHSWMVYAGYYDYAKSFYAKSCEDAYCPVHGLAWIRSRIPRMIKCLNAEWEFRHLVLHLNSYPSSGSISKIVSDFSAIVRSQAGVKKVKVVAIPHYLEGDWHINFGVSFSETVAFGDRTAPSGQPSTKSGRKCKKLNLDLAQETFLPKSRKYIPDGRWSDTQNFINQPANWVLYHARWKAGFAPNETPPHRQGYHWQYGFTGRKKQAHHK